MEAIDALRRHPKIGAALDTSISITIKAKSYQMVTNDVTNSEPPNLKTGVGLFGGVEKGVES